MRLLVILVALLFSSCSKDATPQKINVLCGVDSDFAQGRGFVSFAINGRKLGASEISVSTYEVTDKGCVIVPHDATGNLKVKSGNYSVVASVEKFKNRLLDKYEMVEVGTEEDSQYIYCGETSEEQYLKFLFPSQVKSGAFYEDIDSKRTPIQLNDLACAKIPKKPGKIVLDENVSTYILNPQNIRIIDKIEPKITGFNNVCQKLYN